MYKLHNVNLSFYLITEGKLSKEKSPGREGGSDGGREVDWLKQGYNIHTMMIISDKP